MSDAVPLASTFDAQTQGQSPSEARLRVILEHAPVSIVEEDWSRTCALLAGLRAQGVTDGPAHFHAHPAFVRECLHGVRVVRRNAQARAWEAARQSPAPDGSLAAVFDSPQALAWFIDELCAVWAGQRIYTAQRTQRGPDGQRATLQVTVALPDLSHSGDATALVSVTDVSDLSRVNTELDTSLKHLARINRELETFTYSVSHDLKSPLRGLDAYSRLLLQSHADALDDEGRQLVGHIRKATHQMGELIEDLLAYSRMERARVAPMRMALAPLVDEVIDEVCEAHPQQQPRFTLDVPAQLQVEADVQGLTMALRNLLDNAIKFAKPGQPPEIHISARSAGGVTDITVRDHGVGFDMKHHDRIFEIFQRLHAADDRPGTGVGLAIVRKAMERMGGTVQAHSSAGAGATFTLRLPQQPA